MNKRRRNGKKGKKETSSLTYYVVFSIIALVVFTVTSLVILLKTGLEAPTLTTCFFGVFGGEILTCGLIKIFKLKETKKEGEGLEFIDLDE